MPSRWWRVAPSSRRFWKVPPESATVSRPPALGACSRSGQRDRLVECSGDLGARPPLGEIVLHPAHECGPVPERPRVRLRRNSLGKLLQLDRRLSLVRHLFAHAEQRCNRVEEPSHPGRERRVYLQALPHDGPALERHWPFGSFEVGRARAPGLPDRSLAAGQRNRRRGVLGARTTRGHSAAARRPRASRRFRNPSRRR